MRALVFDRSDAERLARIVSGDDRLVLRRLDPAPHATAPAATQWERSFAHVSASLEAAHDDPILSAELQRHALLTTLSTFHTPYVDALQRSRQRRAAPRTVRRAIAHIEAHAKEPLTLEDIARGIRDLLPRTPARVPPRARHDADGVSAPGPRRRRARGVARGRPVSSPRWPGGGASRAPRASRAITASTTAEPRAGRAHVLTPYAFGLVGARGVPGRADRTQRMHSEERSGHGARERTTLGKFIYESGVRKRIRRPSPRTPAGPSSATSCDGRTFLFVWKGRHQQGGGPHLGVGHPRSNLVLQVQRRTPADPEPRVARGPHVDGEFAHRLYVVPEPARRRRPPESFA